MIGTVSLAQISKCSRRCENMLADNYLVTGHAVRDFFAANSRQEPPNIHGCVLFPRQCPEACNNKTCRSIWTLLAIFTVGMYLPLSLSLSLSLKIPGNEEQIISSEGYSGRCDDEEFTGRDDWSKGWGGGGGGGGGGVRGELRWTIQPPSFPFSSEFFSLSL